MVSSAAVMMELPWPSGRPSPLLMFSSRSVAARSVDGLGASAHLEVFKLSVWSRSGLPLLL